MLLIPGFRIGENGQTPGICSQFRFHRVSQKRSQFKYSESSALTECLNFHHPDRNRCQRYTV